MFTVFTSLQEWEKKAHSVGWKGTRRGFCELTLNLPVSQPAHRHQPTWSVVAASSLTAAAAATGAGTTATSVPPPRRPSLRWTAAPMKAYKWNRSRETSLMPKSQRYEAVYVPFKVLLPKVLAPYGVFFLSLSVLCVSPSLLCLTCAVFSLSQSSFRGVYKCLWPSCGKVLTSSVGIKRHIRVLHLGWVSILCATDTFQSVPKILSLCGVNCKIPTCCVVCGILRSYRGVSIITTVGILSVGHCRFSALEPLLRCSLRCSENQTV